MGNSVNQGQQSQDIAAVVIMTLLLIFSAFKATSQFAIWVGMIMLVLVWFKSYTTGQAGTFFQSWVK